MSSESTFWYDKDADSSRGRRVLEALRLYQAAEAAMRRRTRQAMALHENEMLVLRFVIRATGEGTAVTPTDIARYLGISTASTTALIDRLEVSGHMTRSPHPTDRRSVIVATTPQAVRDVRTTLAGLHEGMMAATRGITETQSDAIVGFLDRMRAAVDDVAEPRPRRRNTRSAST